LLDARLARNAEALPKAVARAFEEADPGRLLASCGVEEKRVREIVRELGESEAPLVLAGASIPHTNSLDAVVASHYVNLMLGAVGRSGGVQAPGGSGETPDRPQKMPDRPQKTMVAPDRPQKTMVCPTNAVVLIDGTNPVYTMPASAGVADALAGAELVISFGCFLDDSAAFADLLMPDHHELESEMAIVPAVSAGKAVALSTPFVEPLYGTRAVEATLAQLAGKIGVEYQAVTAREVVESLLAGGQKAKNAETSHGAANTSVRATSTYEDAAREGGIWLDAAPASTSRPNEVALDFAPARFEGDPGQYPFYFQPYPSLQFHDGRGANLPWLQELPDPASSSIWGLPVEIDPKTAWGLKVVSGDMVRVESPHGSIEAPAYVHPGAVPGVVSMAIGDGHAHFSRYASGRGANPLSILAPARENSTGALILGGTRVRLARAGGQRGWTQFSTQDRQERGYEGR
jgi:anaerobic selenocysteine-containing dehydrogenase